MKTKDTVIKLGREKKDSHDNYVHVRDEPSVIKQLTALHQANAEQSRLDRIEGTLKSLLADRYADKCPAPEYGCVGGMLVGNSTLPPPKPSGIMQESASLLSRLTTLTERFSRVRFVLRRTPTENAVAVKERSHEDFAEIRDGQYERVTHLENLAYEIETELGI